MEAKKIEVTSGTLDKKNMNVLHQVDYIIITKANEWRTLLNSVLVNKPTYLLVLIYKPTNTAVKKGNNDKQN